MDENEKPKKKKNRYRIVYFEGESGLQCYECGYVSWNENDLKNRYCTRCKVFLDD